MKDRLGVEGRSQQEVPVVGQLVLAESAESLVKAATEDEVAAGDRRVVPKQGKAAGGTGGG